MGKVKESVGLDSLDGPSPSENFNNLIIESVRGAIYHLGANVE